MPFHPSRFMGDGPVALLVGRHVRHEDARFVSPRRVVLDTNNGAANAARCRDDSATRRHWLAELLGLRSEA